MPSNGGCQSADIAATPWACFDALTDFKSLPQWQGGFKALRYRLRQAYHEPRRPARDDLGGDFRDFCGEWRFEPTPDGVTHAELDLRIDPRLRVPASCAGRPPTR